MTHIKYALAFLMLMLTSAFAQNYGSVGDWSGGYVGISAGAASNTYSGQELNFGNRPFPNDGKGNGDAEILSLTAGYDFQNGNWVYGGALSYGFVDINDYEPCVGVPWQCGLDIKSLASAELRLGYVLNSKTLLIGGLGFATAETFGYTYDPAVGLFGTKKTVDGFSVSLGAERSLTEHMSLSGRLGYYDFNSGIYTVDNGFRSRVKTELLTVEFGLVYRF